MSKASSAAVGPAANPDEIVTIRMELVDTEPLIWREVIAPTSITLKVLHEIIQIVMGWFDYHLWEFTIGGRGYGIPMKDDWRDEPLRDAGKTRLRDVLKPGETEIGYAYDFGDSWEMRLVATDVHAGEPGPLPSYVGGEQNAPPEDCGGIPGFYNLLDALADENHPDHAELRGWCGEYDPNALDELPIKHALGRIAARRKAARKRPAKKLA